MNEPINRRRFLGASLSLVAAGVAGCSPRREEKPPLDDRFTYNVDEFLHTDPALLRYHETGTFPTGFREPKCLTVAGDAILVGGDTALKTFDLTGKLLSSRGLPATPHTVTDTGIVAFKDRVEGGTSLGDRAHITALAVTDDTLYIADAGNREVLCCDRVGKIRARIKGFSVPSPYFDLHIGPEGLLWVVNPGKHRIEAYNPDGTLELSWGATGMSIENFCGCCNPVYVTRLPNGRFVTSEKGLNRIKLYDPRGQFLGVVAGPDQLVQDLELAKKACANCQIGFGFDITADAAGRVYALDPATKSIRIFTPKPA